MAGRGQVSWLPGLGGRTFPGLRCPPQWLARRNRRARGFLSRSQWRDRAGFAPDFP